MCRFASRAFALLYAAALCLLLIGQLGLFGAERDPLAGVFLMPLGLPWNLLVTRSTGIANPIVAVLAPALNLALTGIVCRTSRRRRGT